MAKHVIELIRTLHAWLQHEGPLGGLLRSWWQVSTGRVIVE